MASLFNKSVENDVPPKAQTGAQVFDMIKKIKVMFGKVKK
jgi:hypothetical protein